jgi:putative transposase
VLRAPRSRWLYPISRAEPPATRRPANDIPVTNLLERLFVEERRRLKIIPNGFGEKPVLKLMFGALIRAAERWRGLRFTEFELRQLAAVRHDLDAEYQAKVTPSDRSSQLRFSSKSAP